MASTPRFLLLLSSLAGAAILTGCDPEQSSPPPLQATGAASVGCQTGQGYQHTTLGYHLCFPSAWASRDYTAEPGAGGAVSVVAFGPPRTVPAHVPAQGGFIPPIEVRVIAGPKDQQESSLTQGNQVTQTQVAGISADRIVVADSGPANGSIIVVLEHQANTFELEEAPGGTDDGAFQLVLGSFSFPS